jgi:hypothetical protein
MTLPLSISLAQDDPLKHFVKTGNTGPSIRRTLLDAETGLPVDLTGAIAIFVATESDKSTVVIHEIATVESPASGGIVRYDFTADDTSTAGTFMAEFQITWPEGQTVSYPPANSDPDRSYIRLQIVDGLALEA